MYSKPPSSSYSSQASLLAVFTHTLLLKRNPQSEITVLADVQNTYDILYIHVYTYIYEKPTVQFASVALAQALPNEHVHAYTCAAFLDLFYQPLVRSSDQSISAELSKITVELAEIDGKRASNMSEVRRIEERVKRLGTEVTQKVRRVTGGRRVRVKGGEDGRVWEGYN